MTLARLLRTLARRAVTSPGSTLLTVGQRLVDEPAYVLVKADSLMSGGQRRRLYPALHGIMRGVARLLPRATWPALLVAFTLHGLGRTDDAEAWIRDRAATATPRQRLAFAALLGEVDRAAAGLALIADLADIPRVQRVRGRVRWRAGQLTAAVAELRAAAVIDRRASTARVADRVAQDLRALQPGWLPDVPAGAPDTGGRRLPEPAPHAGRVLHFINNALPQVQAGYTVRAHRIALAQRDAGLDPVMVTKVGFPYRQGHLDAPAEDVVDGIRYVHVDDPGGERVFGTAERVERSVARLLPVVRELAPSVLHPTTPFDNAQAMLAIGRALGLPVVYEMRGFLEETWLSRQQVESEATERYRLTREVEGWCARQADHVVTLGEAMKADLVARGVDAARITVVPNAVDVDAFQVRGRGGDVRARLGVPDGRVLLGYISSLVSYEGVDTLVRATRQLVDAGHDVGLLVVGDGAARPGWQHLADELLGERANFTGRVPHTEVAAHYEAIDVFVVPRRDERVCRNVTPLKPVEAMAMERALVVSRLPALAEMVTEGETGLTFTPEDPADLAEVVAPLLADPERRAKLGAAARAWVAAERTWARNAERYLDVYRSLDAL